ncbi:hypothetical protein [Pedobacter sp.]|uniref:hypothetical protein n=1 Tax=Pedobacter sp. TaxID=1411316 RepID=UPI003BA88D8F
MKNRTGLIIGFIVGLVGFLLMFKMLVLERIPREDELAPGAVVIVGIFAGVLFAFIGRFVQGRLEK